MGGTAESNPKSRRKFRILRRLVSFKEVATWLTLLCTIIGGCWTAIVWFDQRNIERTLKDQQSTLNGQNVILNRLKIEREARPRIVGESKIELKPSTPGEPPTVRFVLKISNVSENTVEVSWALLHWFIGGINPEAAKSKVWRINEPYDHYLDKSDVGVISWECVDYVLFKYPGWKIPAATHGQLLKFSKNMQDGGLTKTLQNGDYASFSYDFIVPNSPGQWVGFFASIGIDKGNGGAHLFRYDEVIQLPGKPEITQGASPSIATNRFKCL